MYADARDSFFRRTIHFPSGPVRTPSLFAQQCNEPVTLFYLLPTSCLPPRIVRLLNRHVRKLKGHTAVFRLPNQQRAIASIFFSKADEYTHCHRAPRSLHRTLSSGLETRLLSQRSTSCPDI